MLDFLVDLHAFSGTFECMPAKSLRARDEVVNWRCLPDLSVEITNAKGYVGYCQRVLVYTK